jgi:hypothetical protein
MPKDDGHSQRYALHNFEQLHGAQIKIGRSELTSPNKYKNPRRKCHSSEALKQSSKLVQPLSLRLEKRFCLRHISENVVKRFIRHGRHDQSHNCAIRLKAFFYRFSHVPHHSVLILRDLSVFLLSHPGCFTSCMKKQIKLSLANDPLLEEASRPATELCVSNKLTRKHIKTLLGQQLRLL